MIIVGPWKNENPITIVNEAVVLPFVHLTPELVQMLMDYTADTQPDLWEELADIQRLLIG